MPRILRICHFQDRRACRIRIAGDVVASEHRDRMISCFWPSAASTALPIVDIEN
jgi:hypothetical protein